MPTFLLNLLPLVKQFKTPLLYALLAAVVFGAGWKVNGWRLESRYESEAADRAREVATAVSEAVEASRQEYLIDLQQVIDINDALHTDLAEIRSANDALSAEIETAPLVTSSVTCTDNETGEVLEEQPNPFTDDFVRLWNDAGRLHDD
jgi:hypothetical protein